MYANACVSAVSVPVLSKTIVSTFEDSNSPPASEVTASHSSRRIVAHAYAHAEREAGKSEGTDETTILVHFTIRLNKESFCLVSELSSSKNRHAPTANTASAPMRRIESISLSLLEKPAFVLLFSNDWIISPRDEYEPVRRARNIAGGVSLCANVSLGRGGKLNLLFEQDALPSSQLKLCKRAVPAKIHDERWVPLMSKYGDESTSFSLLSSMVKSNGILACGTLSPVKAASSVTHVPSSSSASTGMVRNELVCDAAPLAFSLLPSVFVAGAITNKSPGSNFFEDTWTHSVLALFTFFFCVVNLSVGRRAQNLLFFPLIV
mmetsp:Transcript_53871/g.114455  ORF Transcript_53871/g.114455 Transcript_53871/m.114455 type:complete len:320 (-) Transcript_53871:1364-2323(-)